ncbi:hypothetical protein VIGAN_02123700, partial [Vigna angularis var. angularis]
KEAGQQANGGCDQRGKTFQSRGRVSFSFQSLHSSKTKFIDLDSCSHETQLPSISFLFRILRIPYTPSANQYQHISPTKLMSIIMTKQ